VPDQVIKCIECRTDFTLTEGEQQFFASKGYQPPKRCKPCRQARKAASNPVHEPVPEPVVVHRGPRKARSHNDNYD